MARLRKLRLHQEFGRETTKEFNRWLRVFKKKDWTFRCENSLLITFYLTIRVSPFVGDRSCQRIREIIEESDQSASRPPAIKVSQW